MQLNNPNKKSFPNLTKTVAAASCGLLGLPLSATEESSFWDFSQGWSYDTAFLYYGETDRVSAFEGVFSATKEYELDDSFNFKLVFDTLTGASPSGAVAQSTPQTYTRPSGKGQYDIAAGDQPLDDTFRDTRVQMNTTWAHPLESEMKTSYGIHFSKEFDYLSLGLNGNLAWDLNQKNTTVSFGMALSNDTFTPKGGIPIGFEEMIFQQDFATEDDYWQSFDASRRTDSDTKQTVDFLVGVAQVINKSMIMQLNYSLSKVDGYLTDPFKILSIVNENGETQSNVFEQRPDSRLKHTLFWQTKIHFTDSVFDLSYRYMTDDWKIKSHTVDYRHYFPVSTGGYWQPHIRYYKQEAAEFYHPFLRESEASSNGFPQFASADPRIGHFDAYTLGIKYGWKTQAGNDMAVRFELYHQTIKSAGHELVGELNSLDVYPAMDAIILQYNYSF